MRPQTYKNKPGTTAHVMPNCQGRRSSTAMIKRGAQTSREQSLGFNCAAANFSGAMPRALGFDPMIPHAVVECQAFVGGVAKCTEILSRHR